MSEPIDVTADDSRKIASAIWAGFAILASLTGAWIWSATGAPGMLAYPLGLASGILVIKGGEWFVDRFEQDMEVSA